MGIDWLACRLRQLFLTHDPQKEIAGKGRYMGDRWVSEKEARGYPKRRSQLLNIDDQSLGNIIDY